MIRIYADINSSDEQRRVRLNTVGALADIEMHRGLLVEGMTVILYMSGEFEVEGTLIFDEIWHGVPDWATIRYLEGA